ncbi:MAG: mechanosensitive ion channel [Spirochaetales bacterium]|nr:mechanosensitive ion channel [Spirochaetales bacterium]
MDQIRHLFLEPLTLFEITLPFSLLSLLLQFFLPALACAVVVKLLVVAVKTVIKRARVEDESAAKILRRWKFYLRLVFFIAVVLLFVRLLGAEVQRYSRSFFGLLNTPLLESGSTKVSVVTIILMIPVFYMAAWAGQGSRKITNTYLLNRVGLDESKKFSVSNLVRYLVMFLVLLVGLGIIGIDLSALTVMFGVLGLGLGFGLQTVVANFFAGVVIIFNRPIKEGDRILVDSYEGTVINIRLLSTVINTITYETIIVPNSKLVDSTVYNYSYDDRRIIIKNEVSVSYATDLDKAIEVLSGVGMDNPYALKVPEPDVRVTSFGDSGINLALFTWIRDVSTKHAALSWNNLETWRRFRDNEIEIPFPQVDLHIRSDQTMRARRKQKPI